MDPEDELEDVSDDEFDAVLEEKEKGWESRIGEIDYSLATAKQRKQMKKRQNQDDIDLDDEEVELGDIYSDEGDESDDGFVGFSDDEEDENPPMKKSKVNMAEPVDDRSAEQFGAMMDDNVAVSKQHAWEEKGKVFFGKGKKKFSSKDRKSKFSKKKKSSILMKR